MSKARDRALGMDRTITRRDFLNGCAVTLGASLAASAPQSVSDRIRSPAPLPSNPCCKHDRLSGPRDFAGH